MNDALYDLVGNEVEVRSNSGDDDCFDSGVLESYDHPWVRIRKSEKEILCFPIYNVRLLKMTRRLVPLPPKPHADTLLRPAVPEANAVAPPD